MKEKTRLSKRLCIMALASLLPLVQPRAASAVTDADKFVADAWQQLQKKPQPTENLMTELAAALQKEPQNYQAHYLLGICYQRIGLPDESIKEMKLASQYGPNDPKPILNLIRQAVSAGQMDLASQEVDIAIGRFPSNAEINFWQANFMMRKSNRLAEAEELFNKVIDKDATIPNLPLSLAQLRFAQHRNEEAMNLAKQQLEMTPHAPGASLLIGQIYFQREQYEQAYPYLKEAYDSLVLTPNLARQYMQVAYWTGHYEECLEPAIVQMALSSTTDLDDPNSKQVFVQAAARVPKATVQLIAVKSSVTLDRLNRNLKDPASFHRTLAEALSETGNHQLAVLEYKRCLKFNPKDGVAEFLLAKELEVYTEQYQEALEHYRQAKLKNIPVTHIDLYIEHLQARINNRKDDLAWLLKDYFQRTFGSH